VLKPNEILYQGMRSKKKTYKEEEPLQLASPIKFFTPTEIKRIIEEVLHARKAPGYNLITGRILKELPRKGIGHLTAICNAIIRNGYYPIQWKVAQILMIPKPGKPADEVTSYRPISLLPIMSKVFEKGLLKRLNPILSEKRLYQITNSAFDSNTQPSNKFTEFQK
jgi:hypothetical protein